MYRLMLLLLIGFLAGCARPDSSKVIRDLLPLRQNYSEAYFKGSTAEAKLALWKTVRLDETGIVESKGDVAGGNWVYEMAMAHTRLAMIYEAEGQDEAAEPLYAVALNEWSEAGDFGNEKRFKINKRMAVWTIDSIESQHPPRWRTELKRPPTLVYPRFQVDGAGDIVETKAKPNHSPDPTPASVTPAAGQPPRQP
jgi:hypothetical protein